MTRRYQTYVRHWAYRLGLPILLGLGMLAAQLTSGGMSAVRSQPKWGDQRELASFGWTTVGTGMVASGLTVHYTWWDGEIWYKHSWDGGETWQPHVRLTSTGGKSEMPSLAIVGSALILMWMDHSAGGTDIFVRRSTDSGRTWISETRVTSNGRVFRYAVAASGSLVHLAWTDRLTGCPPSGVPCFSGNLYFRRSVDGGITWEPVVQLTFGQTAARPALAAFRNDVHLTWGDVRDGNQEIYYKRSADGGATWHPDQRITENSWWSGRPAIATSSSGIVYLVWDDGYVVQGGNWDDSLEDLYFTRSADRGRSWARHAPVVSAPKTQTHANLTTGASGIHLTWTDNRDGSWKPYYKALSTDGTSWGPDELLSTAGETWAAGAVETSAGILATYHRRGKIFYRIRRQ